MGPAPVLHSAHAAPDPVHHRPHPVTSRVVHDWWQVSSCAPSQIHHQGVRAARLAATGERAYKRLTFSLVPCPRRPQADRVTRRFTVGDDPDGAPPPGTLYDVRHFNNWSRGTRPYQYALRLCGWCPDGAGMPIALVRASGEWRSDFCSMHSETFWKRRISLDEVTAAAREALELIIAEPPQVSTVQSPLHHPPLLYK